MFNENDWNKPNCRFLVKFWETLQYCVKYDTSVWYASRSRQFYSSTPPLWSCVVESPSTTTLPWTHVFLYSSPVSHKVILSKISGTTHSGTATPLSRKAWWCILQCTPPFHIWMGVQRLVELLSSLSSSLRQSDLTTAQKHGLLQCLSPFGILSRHQSDHFWVWHNGTATKPEKELLHIRRECKESFLNIRALHDIETSTKLLCLMSRVAIAVCTAVRIS